MRVLKIIGFLFMLLSVSCVVTNSKISQIQDGTLDNVVPTITVLSKSTATLPILPPTATITPMSVETIEYETEQPVVPTYEPAETRISGSNVVVDHTAIEKFSLIPDQTIAKAALLRVMFRHASVGENIRYGLECIYGNYATRRPNSCSKFHNIKYDSSSWIFQFRGNPGWIEKVDDFVRESDLQIDQFDVFMFTLGYLDGFDGMQFPEISDPENFNKLLIEKLEALEIRHPEKQFVWWTMSLAQVGHENTTKFNEMIRDYAGQNGKVLVDLADIETYDPQGNPCFDINQHPIICSDYTDEKQSGHLNQLGRERAAKAFWYLMARLTGWSDS
jgi:hypothetical protein